MEDLESDSVASQRRLLEEFSIRQKANSLTLSVPTDDRIVRLSLRYYGEPITLFGEDKYDRRERLRVLVARKVVIEGETYVYFPEVHMPPTSHTDAPLNEPFYTLGVPGLLQKRRELCHYSLLSAKRYVVRMRELQKHITRKEVENNNSNFHRHIIDNLEAKTSQVGDDRPLTHGSYSHTGDHYATTGWTGLIKVWDTNTATLTHTLRGVHTDKIHSITWKKTNKHIHTQPNHHNLTNINFAATSADSTVSLWDLNKHVYTHDNDDDDGHDCNNNYSLKEDYEDVYMDISLDRHSRDLESRDLESRDLESRDLESRDLESRDLESRNDSSKNGIFEDRNQKFSPKLASRSPQTINKCVMTLKGHEGRVNKAIFNPTHTHLVATCSTDETWRLWDIERGIELLFQEGHGCNVLCICFNNDGGLLISGDNLGRVVLWDIRIGKAVCVYKEHTKLVYTCDFDPLFTHRCITGSLDNTMNIYDLRSQKLHKHVLTHNKLITQTLFEPYFSRYILTSSYDQTIKLWSTNDFSLIHTLPTQETRVMHTDIHPHNTHFSVLGYDRIWKTYHTNNHSHTFNQQLLPFI